MIFFSSMCHPALNYWKKTHPKKRNQIKKIQNKQINTKHKHFIHVIFTGHKHHYGFQFRFWKYLAHLCSNLCIILVRKFTNWWILLCTPSWSGAEKELEESLSWRTFHFLVLFTFISTAIIRPISHRRDNVWEDKNNLYKMLNPLV